MCFFPEVAFSTLNFPFLRLFTGEILCPPDLNSSEESNKVTHFVKALASAEEIRHMKRPPACPTLLGRSHDDLHY